MIPKYKPYFDVEEIKALFDFSDDIVEKFEEKFAKLVGSKYALSFPYGRSGLYALLKSQNIKNSEIIIPAYTCIVVPNAILATNNIPKFVDIKLTDYNMDLDKLDQCITNKTKAIIPTHMFGYPMDVKRVRDIIQDHNRENKMLIIEDACLSLLAKDVGKYSDAAFYSFNIGKHLVTFDGSIVTTNNEEIYRRLKKYKNENFTKTSVSTNFKKFAQLLGSYIIFNESVYGFVYTLWKNSNFIKKYTKNWSLEDIRMPIDFLEIYPSIQAKIGIAQIKKAKEIIEKRKRNVKTYNKELKNTKGILLPPIIEGATYSHYTIRVKNRKDFERKMEKQGIQVGRTFDYSIPHVPVYSKYRRNEDDFENSLVAANEIVNLPAYPSMGYEDIKYICKCVRGA